jgi:hypothetical protein
VHGRAFLQHEPVSLPQPPIILLQLVCCFSLNPDVIEASLTTAGGDGKVYPRKAAVGGQSGHASSTSAARRKVWTLVRTCGHAHTEIWTATKWDRFKEIVRTL